MQQYAHAVLYGCLKCSAPGGAYNSVYVSPKLYNQLLLLLNACSLVDAACRVLRPGGTMMMITYGPPFARLPWMLLPGMDWDVQVWHTP